MTKRIILAAAAFAILAMATPVPAEERSAAVFVNPGIRPYGEVLEGFTSSCGCAVEVLPLAGGADPPAVEKLSTGKLKLVLAIGLDAFTASETVRDLPVLATMVPDLRSRAGGRSNLSGVEMLPSPARQLESMARFFPAARRIGVVFDPATQGEYIREARSAAQALGLVLVEREAARAGEVLSHLDGLKRGCDVFWMLPEPAFAQPEILEALLLFSFQNRVPIFSFAKKYVALGAAAALTIDPRTIGIQAGEMAKAMRSGESPRNGPRLEYARGGELVFNGTVAQKMGLRFGREALMEATDVSH